VFDKAKMQARQATLTHDRLTEVLSYNRESGIFTWKKIGRGYPKGEAGNLNTNGHRQIGIDRKYWVAHRLAWFYVHGVWPENEIDHRDLNKDNNALENGDFGRIA
jgi:hypothetical protein